MDFTPLRSSTPPRARAAPRVHAPSHVSNSTLSSTTSSTLPLSALTPANIQVIDAIIQRSPYTATTFLSVFKAYNEILEELGLDAREDVTYYGFLLKLGVVKGKDWGTRWQIVKQELRDSSWHNEHLAHDQPDDETDDGASSFVSDVTETHAPVPADTPRPAPRAPFQRPSLPINRHSAPLVAKGFPVHNKISALSGRHATPNSPAIQHTPLARKPRIPPLHISPSSDSELSDAANTHLPEDEDVSDEENDNDDPDDRPFSTKTPAYLTSASDVQKRTKPVSQGTRLYPRPSPALGKLERPAHARLDLDEQGVNGHDFWQVADMERDADDLRDEMLIRHCWEVWRTGVQWVVTTTQQVDVARDHIILRSKFLGWLDAYRRAADLVQRVEYVDDIRRVRFAFRTWQQAIENKRRKEFREGVRRRFSLIRKTVDARILRVALKTWVLSHKLVLATSRRNNTTLRIALHVWKERLLDISDMSQNVEQFKYRSKQMCQLKALDVWRRRVNLKVAENIIRIGVNKRLVQEALEVWMRTAKLHALARMFNGRHLLKKKFAAWQARMIKVKTLVRRVNTHVRRQDALLLRAIMRIWIAKERGQRLDSIQRKRLAMDVFETWRARMTGVRQLQTVAITHFDAHTANTLAHFMARWQTHVLSRQQALETSTMHYDRALMRQAIVYWQARRWKVADTWKRGKAALQHLLWKRYMKKWREKTLLRVLDRREATYQQERLRRLFVEWRDRVRMQRRLDNLALVFQNDLDLRLLQRMKSIWVTRTINIKDAMLHWDAVNVVKIKREAVNKWKACMDHQKYQVDLAECVEYDRQQNNIRRTFMRWRRRTQDSIQQREYLQRKEEEDRHALVSLAWERWRDKYEEAKLSEVETDMRIQLQANLLFRTFQLWISKTYSVPAVRLYARRTKMTALHKWIKALPRARLEGKAREIDRQGVLRKALAKWLSVYRTKMRIRAVVRAGYLKLPTASATAPTSITPRPRTAIGTRNSPFPSRALGSTPGASSSTPSQLIRPRTFPASAPPAREPEAKGLADRRSLSPSRPPVVKSLRTSTPIVRLTPTAKPLTFPSASTATPAPKPKPSTLATTPIGRALTAAGIGVGIGNGTDGGLAPRRRRLSFLNAQGANSAPGSTVAGHDSEEEAGTSSAKTRTGSTGILGRKDRIGGARSVDGRDVPPRRG